TFGEDKLVGDVLTDFLRGAITAAGYWEMWRRSQNWSDRRGDDRGGFTWPDSSFGGGTRPGSGGSWGRLPGGSGGGFSRPRSGSAGTRKHGGFKTGGGF